jgi:hypothetical protein
MATLLTPGGKELCVLTAFKPTGAVGQERTPFTAQAHGKGLRLRSDEPVLIEDRGVRYNAKIQVRMSVARDDEPTIATISGEIWPI